VGSIDVNNLSFWVRGSHMGWTMVPLDRALLCSYRSSIVTISILGVDRKLRTWNCRTRNISHSDLDNNERHSDRSHRVESLSCTFMSCVFMSQRKMWLSYKSQVSFRKRREPPLNTMWGRSMGVIAKCQLILSRVWHVWRVAANSVWSQTECDYAHVCINQWPVGSSRSPTGQFVKN